MIKPSVFIGSSSEGLDFARAVRSLLCQDAEITLWNEGFFTLSNTFIETLVNSLPQFDFAILVMTSDDLVRSRKVESFGPRDNVVFELGLFMGHLGRSRTFIIHQANADVKIPSDLSGMITATYEWPRKDESHQAAVGAACDSIRKVIRSLSISDRKTDIKMSKIESRQETIESRVWALQLIVKGLITKFEYDKLVGLAASDPFMVRFHNDMYRELKHLDAIGYVQPKQGEGLVSIRDRDGSSDEFDLKQYVQITPEGLEYLKLRDELSESLGSVSAA